MKSTVIFGPPGTGKTTKLIEILKDRCDRPNPDVAVFSFSRAASRELIDRCKELPVQFVGTIHSFCFRTLGMSKASVALLPDFTTFAGGDPINIEFALNIHGMAKRTGYQPDQIFLQRRHLPCAYEMVKFYTDMYEFWKTDNGLADFDDMITNLIRQYSSGASGRRFKTVIVDEAQDLSFAQWLLIKCVVADDGELIVAGDDDQAIFTWAGAHAHGMTDMMKGAEHIVLSQSHRLPLAVFNVATKTIEQVKRRKAKEWTYRKHIGYFFVDTSSRTIDWNETKDDFHLVMVRDKWAMKPIEQDLIQQGLRYKISGSDSGPGLFMGRAANTARMLIKKDGDPHFVARRVKPWAAVMLTSGQWPDNWEDAIIADVDVVNYLLRVDLFAQPQVELSTIHAQKGREADHCIVVGTCTPASMDNDIEDEIRVWYVALTRAKEGLTIVDTNSFIRF